MGTKEAHPAAYLLLKAAADGDKSLLQNLLRGKHFDVNCRCDDDGSTPLMITSAMGHVDCARLLISHGADVDICKQTGANALFYAAERNNEDVVVLLLRSGLSAVKCGGIALFVAAQQGHFKVVQHLIKAGCDVNFVMPDGAGALFVAVQNGHLHVVRALLQNGADVNTDRTDGTTPLWIACQMGHTTIIKELIKFGAKVDKARNDGATPLFKAAHKGHIEAIEVLLDRGASVGLLKNGESALHAACLFGNYEAARMLIQAGADVRLKNQNGETALQLAEQLGYDSIINLLKRFNEQPYVRNDSHRLL